MLTITNEYIIQCLINYYNSNNKIPNYTLTSTQLGVSPTLIRTRFGTLDKALIAANLPTKIKFDSIVIQCHNCGTDKIIRHSEISKSGFNYCSSSCAAIYNNTGTKLSNDTKLKISNTLKQRPKTTKPIIYHNLICHECKSTFIATNKKRKLCSKSCQKISNSRLMSIWLATNRKHIKGPHQQSYMEQSFEHWLNDHNYKNSLSGYLMEVRFFNPDTKKNGWADFVFPRLKLIIELDGSHHIKRKQLDDIRDAHLLSRGWTVLRITHKEYQSQTRISEIKQLLHIP